MPMSFNLTALPPELITYVITNIESQPTLYHLAQCSRQLYRYTIPHLYQHVTIHDEVRKGEQGNGRLQNLASLLIRRPDLAELVRHFTLHVARPSRVRAEPFEEPGDSDSSEELEESEHFEELEDSEFSEGLEESEHFEALEDSEERISPKIFEVDQAFTTAINALSFSKEEENYLLRRLSQTHRCHHSLIIPLLLPTLLKVEKVVLDVNIGFNTHYLGRIIRRAVRRERPFDIQPPFKALTVFVLSYDRFSALNIDTLALLLKLPAIQEISGGFGGTVDDEFIEIRDADEDPIESDSSSSSLISLDLVAYGLSTEALDNMLRAPKALKTFFYKFCPSCGITIGDICDYLGPQKNCLESLGLDCDEGQYTGVVYAGGSVPMPSFVSFNALKVFKIAVSLLERTVNGVERNLISIFPRNLETLHLTRFQAISWTILEAIEDLLARKSSQQIPLLKKLILEQNEAARPSDTYWGVWHETAVQRLSRVAGTQGVSIEELYRKTGNG